MSNDLAPSNLASSDRRGSADRRQNNSGLPEDMAERRVSDGDRRLENNFMYVSFYVGDQLLGITIEEIQEVLDMQRICRVPLAHPAITGLLNLRGQIVTAIDLRKRLGLPKLEDNSKTMNIVVNHEGELFSLIVDAVGDVLAVHKDSFDPSPSTLDECWRQCSHGVHRLKDGLLVVVSVKDLINLKKMS